jgi:hypothetical protein
MLPIHVAVVSRSRHIDAGELSSVAAAVQVQVTRDFGPVWGVNATANAFPAVKDVPLGWWVVTIEDDIHTPGAGGFHLARNGQPYALVQYSDTWSLAVSHETLEMLADPSGNRTQAAPSPEDNVTQSLYLVEVCDPCEAAEYAYSIDGILVSDFILPRYYDAVPRGIPYSFSGAVSQPRQVLRGGYVSYLDESDHIMRQRIWPAGAQTPSVRELGPMTLESAGTIREWVDSRTDHPELERGASKEVGAVAHALSRIEASRAGRAARAQELFASIGDSTRAGGDA